MGAIKKHIFLHHGYFLDEANSNKELVPKISEPKVEVNSNKELFQSLPEPKEESN